MFLNSGFYTSQELRDAGFKNVGENVLIEKNCTVIGMNNISIGNNVRIDGYCTLIANSYYGITLGNFIHIGAYSLLSGGRGITMEDFSGISQGVRLYSKTDDYSGAFMTNPTIPDKFTGGDSGPILIKKHAIIGSGTIILPNVIIGTGSSVGALSLVMKNLDEWGMYFGSPVKKLKKRSKKLLAMENDFLHSNLKISSKK